MPRNEADEVAKGSNRTPHSSATPPPSPQGEGLFFYKKIPDFQSRPENGRFFVYVAQIRTPFDTNFWNGLILTKPYISATMVSRGHPESEKRKEQTKRGLAKMRKNGKQKKHRIHTLRFYDEGNGA